jgi:hypothetical protein
MPRLRDIAAVKSKNAGPFVISFDIWFADTQLYERVKRAEALSPAVLAEALRLVPADCEVLSFDPGLAIKCNIRRPVPSGAAEDWDVYGGAQDVAVGNIEVDASLLG